MRLRLIFSAVFLVVLSDAARAAAPPIELELVTERGVQITAPREWLQLLGSIGIEHVRIRGGQAGDEPQLENRGNAQRGSYHVVGVLTSQDQLRLPGGTFTRADRARLKDYFAKLAADGADAVTAPHVRFGLTEKELVAVFADLAQPIDFETKGQTPRIIIRRLEPKFASKLEYDTDAYRIMQAGAPVLDELKGLSAGTALAMTLRNSGLVMRPEKKRGQPVVYRVVVAGPDSIRESTLGKPSAKDIQYWPIGWEPEQPPGEVAPSLMEPLNAEIDGYTMEEALSAIAPRLKVPMLIDHAALKARGVDPVKIQVKLAKTRISYKLVIDRVLAQAHMGSDIRVDEAGTPFLWITR